MKAPFSGLQVELVMKVGISRTVLQAGFLSPAATATTTTEAAIAQLSVWQLLGPITAELVAGGILASFRVLEQSMELFVRSPGATQEFLKGFPKIRTPTINDGVEPGVHVTQPVQEQEDMVIY